MYNKVGVGTVNTNEPFENLRDAIVVQTVSDFKLYMCAMVREYKKGNDKKSELAYFRVKECVNWFKSQDFEYMTTLKNGEDFARYLFRGSSKEQIEVYRMWEVRKNEHT
jgi:hypothetical protein